MKKLLVSVIIALCCFTAQTAHAQAFSRGVKVFGIGVGGSNFIHFWGDRYNYGPWGYSGTFTRTTAQINIQGEFGVHDYVGIGFTTGLGFAGGSAYFYNGEINFPIGVIGNFHFWNLIDDKASADLHSDKLDIYGGLNIGSGFAALFYDAGFDENETDLVAILFVGPQVGVRYYFTDSFGVNAEVGYGKSWVNAGIVFKID